MQTAIQIHALETITRQLPQIVKQLERIANALEDIDKTSKKETEVKA